MGNLSIPEKVLLVVKKETTQRHGFIKQAYMVDPTNKRQLESARKWGTYTKSNPELFGQITIVEPDEIYTDNSGFKLTIMESADNSSQGGKLSFWNCVIEKEPDLKVMIGINQDGLLSLIKQSTIVNGTVTNPVSLARGINTVSAVHPEMSEWAESIKPKKNVPKTTKWEIGREYKSISTRMVYMGKIYSWIDTSEEYRDEKTGMRNQTIKRRHLTFTLRDKPIEKHIAYDISHDNRYHFADKVRGHKFATVSDLLTALTENLNNTDIKMGYELMPAAFLYWPSYELIDKPKPREAGEKLLEEDDYTSKLNEFLEVARNKAFGLNGPYLAEDFVPYFFGCTTSPDKKPQFTEAEIERLKLLCGDCNHINF